MSKRYCIFLTALFCAFLGVFLVANAVSPDTEFSQMENRVLAQRPTLEAKDFKLTLPLEKSGDFFTGKFMSDFETYVTDQFVGRDSWISAKSRTEKLLGKQENNGVYFCDQSTLITRFDAPDQKKLTNNLGYVEQFARKAPGQVYFSLIPTQACIWADRLPAGAPNASQPDVLEQAKGAVPGAAWADLYTPLAAHAGEDVFYRTDHHWTSLGAYYGYTGLCQAMGLTPVPLSQYEKTTVTEDFYGTVFSSSGVRWVKPDAIDVYVPDAGITVTSHTFDAQGRPVEEPRALYDFSYLEVKDKYSMFLGGQQPLAVIKTAHTDAPKVLIIRDSYTDSLVPFLTAHFSEIHLIDLRYYKFSASNYMAEHGIDTAVVLYSVPNFVSDSNLVWLAK